MNWNWFKGSLNLLDTLNSEEFEYKGKRYRVWKIKEEQRVIPVGEKYNNDEETERKKIIVKDYNERGRNTTVNVNGETIVIGWGLVKYLTFWGSIIFLIVIVIYFARRRLIKMYEASWKKNSEGKKEKNEISRLKKK